MRFNLAMTAFRRPESLDRVLGSIRGAARRDRAWGGLYIRLEPHPKRKQILAVLDRAEREGGIPPVLGFWNPVTYGPYLNPAMAIDDAFADGEAEVVAYVQDDCVVSPDFFSLVEWFGDLRDRDKYLALNGFAYWSDPSRPEDVVEHRGEGAVIARGYASRFPGLAFAFSRASWERWGRPAWVGTAGNEDAALGPDWSLSQYLDGSLKGPERGCLAPAWARCRHLDDLEGGSTFCSDGLQREVYGRIPWNESAVHVPPDGWRIGPPLRGGSLLPARALTDVPGGIRR